MGLIQEEWSDQSATGFQERNLKHAEYNEQKEKICDHASHADAYSLGVPFDYTRGGAAHDSQQAGKRKVTLV